MRLPSEAGELIMRDRVQWLRCAFSQTALIDDIVTLEPQELEAITSSDSTPYSGAYAGLGFDRHCRLYHVQREQKQLEYLLWGKTSTLSVHSDVAQPYELTSSAQTAGDFAGAGSLPQQPQALICDESDYVYLGDDQSQTVDGRTFWPLWRIDSWQHEVVQRIELPAAVLDLQYAGGWVYALLAADASGAQSLWTFSPCDPPQRLAWPSDLSNAQRLDIAAADSLPSRIFVLCDAGTAGARVVCVSDTNLQIAMPFCTDFLIADYDPEFGWRLVFARRPGEDFFCRRLHGRKVAPLPGLQAPNYDGRGIALAPDNRIAYWTSRGLRHAAPARTRYLEQGQLIGYALDSDHDQNEWGRLRIEACIPPGTRIQFRALSRDELDYHDALTRTPPAGEALSEIALEDLTPLPSALDWSQAGNAQDLFEAPSTPPLGATPAAGFAFYDAPLIAPAGRYMWLAFTLSGTRSKTPRLRSVRIEYPRHQLLRQLPKTLWRDPQAADFLGRYLMPSAALLKDWGDAAQLRHRLLDPRIAPSAALDWLGSLIGLVMDPCWPERARRLMLREASQLFAIRGTLAALRRMIEILSGGQVLIVEKFRLRQGGVIGNAQAQSASAVLGAGFRVGGSIGVDDAEPARATASAQDFNDFAHRFSVTIVANLSSEQLRAVRRLIETHKPAHTMFDVCTAATGARVGLGLHLDLAAVIGRSSGFSPLIVDDAVLGRGYLLGRPAPQTRRRTQAPGGWQRADEGSTP